eukprot:TRINITY_DN4348_c0_g1_i11.p1 TRINITY_DN4348_c0_g1~~TRINITY_DN4348_c0_g1_i11.p1  ORF type:complete len:368 (-),score=50.99 TRINITY_DN4348_c0_g1_i11:75-1178(-)
MLVELCQDRELKKDHKKRKIKLLRNVDDYLRSIENTVWYLYRWNWWAYSVIMFIQLCMSLLVATVGSMTGDGGDESLLSQRTANVLTTFIGGSGALLLALSNLNKYEPRATAYEQALRSICKLSVEFSPIRSVIGVRSDDSLELHLIEDIKAEALLQKIAEIPDKVKTEVIDACAFPISSVYKRRKWKLPTWCPACIKCCFEENDKDDDDQPEQKEGGDAKNQSASQSRTKHVTSEKNAMSPTARPLPPCFIAGGDAEDQSDSHSTTKRDITLDECATFAGMGTLLKEAVAPHPEMCTRIDVVSTSIDRPASPAGVPPPLPPLPGALHPCDTDAGGRATSSFPSSPSLSANRCVSVRPIPGNGAGTS